MKNYVATFYTHFGALKFNKDCKKLSVKSKQMPVPRVLSSSCGTCVSFETDDVATLLKQVDLEDMEGCFLSLGKDDYNEIKF
ncbi:MAG: DUF3343 domain-containing protein [Clostridia bacterium]|nr:DUF3343 domain-containing protein [Clostridia bacterium]